MRVVDSLAYPAEYLISLEALTAFSLTTSPPTALFGSARDGLQSKTRKPKRSAAPDSLRDGCKSLRKRGGRSAKRRCRPLTWSLRRPVASTLGPPEKELAWRERPKSRRDCVWWQAPRRAKAPAEPSRKIDAAGQEIGRGHAKPASRSSQGPNRELGEGKDDGYVAAYARLEKRALREARTVADASSPAEALNPPGQ